MNVTSSNIRRRGYWWSKIVALVAIVNLVLALFDISYIPARNLYLEKAPQVIQFYDPFKGIEPHRLTEKYLATVNKLNSQIDDAESTTAIPEETLADLRQQSVVLIDENPFYVAGKIGTFARIKHRVRQQMGTDSAKVGFQKFWSRDYFQTVGSDTALSFFNREIAPLMATNYFRNIDDSGRFVDRSWTIDIWFSLFFALNWSIGSLVTSWGNPAITWFDAIWQRWYDALLILPFWRWLRVIPVTIKLHQAGLVNLSRLLDDLTYDTVAYLADRVSNFAMVRLIDEIQTAIKQGRVARLLLQQREYLTINDVDEQEAIADRFLEILIYDVLPDAQPQLQALLDRSVVATLKTSELYKQWSTTPLLGKLPTDLTGQISANITQTLITFIKSAYKDPEVRKAFQELKGNMGGNLSQEMRKERTVLEMQRLILDWLEEIKINYIHHAAQMDPKSTLAEVGQLSGIKPL